MYDKNSGEFRYMPGSAMTNLFLADEINRASPKTQSALLEVMQEGKLSVDGKTYPVPSALHRHGNAEPLRLFWHAGAP